jgi:hypothetical protein
VNILSSRRVSLLALSLLVAAVAPAACTGDPQDSSSREQVSSARQADTATPDHEWLFAEASGTTTADAASTNAVAGTLGASASLGGGQVTLSANASFDPESNVDFGTSAAAFGTSDFTVAHWYKTTFGGGGLLGDVLGNRVDSSGGQFISVRINGGGQVTLEVDDNGDGNYAATGSNVAVNDGAWHHLAFVRQGGTVTIYVDGAASGSGSAPSGQPANVADDGSASFRIGRRLGDCCGNFLSVPSSYADLRLYYSALGEGDIGSIITAGSSCSFGTYNCGGAVFGGCQSSVPCDTGGHCTDDSGCASGSCSGGTCQAVEGWACNYNCYSFDSACHDVQADKLDTCIAACDDDSTCLDGCYGAYSTAYDACDAQVSACQSVCNGSCSDGTQDNGETSVDHGGPCTP